MPERLPPLTMATPETPSEPAPPEAAPAPARRGLPALSPQERERYLPEMQRFLDRETALFATIAQDPSLHYQPHPEGFFFEAEHGIVGLDARFWKLKAEGAITTDHIRWACLHELAHFRDLRDDPEGYLEVFAREKREAQRLAPLLERRWAAEAGGTLPGHVTEQDKNGLTPAARVLQKQLRSFRNQVDDIHVNERVAMTAAPYARGRAGAAGVADLYRNVLFPREVAPPEAGLAEPPVAADYRKLPRSAQFAHALLRRHMVPEEEVLVAPEVAAALQKRVGPPGKQRPLWQYVDGVCRPAARFEKGEFVPGKKRDAASNRTAAIVKYVEPLFLQLLRQDLQDVAMPPPPPPRPPGGAELGPPGGERPNPWETGAPEPEITEEHVRAVVERERERRKTPEQRAEDERRRAEEAFAGRHGLSPSALDLYRRLLQEAEPYRRELAKVFESVLATLSEQLTERWETGFKSGRLDMQRLIQRYGQYFTKEGQAHFPLEKLGAYERRTFEQRLQLVPDTVRVRLLIDGSVSMKHDGRIHEARRVAVLLLEGLKIFEETVNLRFDLAEPFSVATEVWLFGDAEPKPVKPLRRERRQDERERAERIRAVGQIAADFGSTDDAPAWSEIDRNGFSPADEQAAHAGRLVDLAIEITDGGSSSPKETKELTGKLRGRGMVVKAIQIGDDPSDLQKFRSVWGREGETLSGGLKNLAPLVGRLLKEQLEKMRIQAREAGAELP